MIIIRGLKTLIIVTSAVLGFYFYNNHTPVENVQPPSVTSSATSSVTGQLEAHFIDVGQADSILIKLPDSKSILIDAGNNADGDLVVDYIKKQRIDTINYIIATHPHEDHIGGMDNVIRTFNIGEIYMPKATTNTKTFEDLLYAIKAKNLTVNSAKAGLVVIDSDGVKAEFIAPSSSSYESLNNYSAVLKVKYGENTFLFTGDAESESEMEILKFADVKADLLKVGHHGSATGTTQNFINAVKPKYAVISVGKGNSYNHPSQKILDRLGVVKVYRTDENGTIIAKSDGKAINIEVEK